MRNGTAVARTLIVCAIIAATTHTVGAQATCSSSTARADSARADLVAVMSSGSPLVAEMRTEQGLARSQNGEDAVIVKDDAACARIAGTFKRPIPPGSSLTVLRMGSLYYVRDPDQQQSTGLITDANFKVLMRFGRAIVDNP
jgi:hypothetical protein